MTILHDNLYTKRAVAPRRGRNRYLSRAMWMKWVPPWRKERLLQKKREMTKRSPNSTTCLAMLSATLGPLSNQQNKHHPNPNRPLHRPARPAHRVALPQALRPVHPPAPVRPTERPPEAHPPAPQAALHPVLPAAHRAVLLPALHPVLLRAHPPVHLPTHQPSLWRRPRKTPRRKMPPSPRPNLQRQLNRPMRPIHSFRPQQK